MTETPPIRFIFGAGEMADHLISLLVWNGRPVQQIELFDDHYPSRTIGPHGLQVRGTIREGVVKATAERGVSMIAIGTKGSAFRYWLFGLLKAAGVPMESAIHSDAKIAPSAKIGNHSIIMPGCIVSKNTTVGELVMLSTGVILEHDNTVNENVFVGPGVVTGGQVIIERHAFIGVGVVLAPKIRIGERSLIGAGAVVVDDIPSGVVALGVPARVVRESNTGSDAPTLEQLRELGCEK